MAPVPPVGETVVAFVPVGYPVPGVVRVEP